MHQLTEARNQLDETMKQVAKLEVRTLFQVRVAEWYWY